jgi:hypothetical protein
MPFRSAVERDPGRGVPQVRWLAAAESGTGADGATFIPAPSANKPWP